jgi:hypothetical protein
MKKMFVVLMSLVVVEREKTQRGEGCRDMIYSTDIIAWLNFELVQLYNILLFHSIYRLLISFVERVPGNLRFCRRRYNQILHLR